MQALPAADGMEAAQKALSDGAKDFAGPDEMGTWGNGEWDHTVQNLSDGERTALHDYTMETNPGGITYHEIQSNLRGLSPDTAAVTSHVAEIDKALAAHPMPVDVMVERGTGISHLPANMYDLVGTDVVDKAFQSTSLGQAAITGTDAVFHMRVAAGTPAMWLEKVSYFGNTEREILLGRDLTYHVDHVLKDELGQWQVYGTVGK